MLVQEAAMYLRWPPSVVFHKAFAPAYDKAGHLMFRGPRYGVAELALVRLWAFQGPGWPS